MRRLLLMLSIAALALLFMPASASAKPMVHCDNVRADIGGKKYVLAIKVKVRGLPCPATNAFWKSFATGEAGDVTTEDLRVGCKDGSKGQQKAAAKRGRMAYTCTSSNGKITTKAWVLGG